MAWLYRIFLASLATWIVLSARTGEGIWPG